MSLTTKYYSINLNTVKYVAFLISGLKITCQIDSNLSNFKIERVNKDTNGPFTWFCANRLSLNTGKTKYIIIKPRQKQCDLSGINICIHNIPLTRIGKGCEEATTFLGIHIDENLSWKQHIAFLNNKISRTLFIIKHYYFTVWEPKDSLLFPYWIPLIIWYTGLGQCHWVY